MTTSILYNSVLAMTNHEKDGNKDSCKLQHMPESILAVCQPPRPILQLQDILQTTARVTEEENTGGIRHSPSSCKVDCSQEFGLQEHCQGRLSGQNIKMEDSFCSY